MDTLDALLPEDESLLAPAEPPEDPDPYFARLPFFDERIAGAVEERFRQWERHMQASGMADLIEKLARHYYGTDDAGISSHGVAYQGERGEYMRTHINHLRSLVKTRLNLALQERIALEAEAGNGDYEAIVQKRKADALIEYEMWDRGLGKKMDEAVEKASHQAWAFIALGWDPDEGEVLMEAAAPGQRPVKTGGSEHRVYGAFDCAFDPYLKSHTPPYYVLRRQEKRHEMEAKYPSIKGQVGDTSADDINLLRLDVGFSVAHGFEKSLDEDVTVYELRHAKTLACPEGRRTVVIGGEVVEDGPLPYADVSVVPFYESTITDTPFFYCEAFDLLAPQHAHNMLNSISVTNSRAGGVGVIATPDGSQFEAEQVGQGLALIKWPGGMEKPQVLHLASTPPEVYENMDRHERSMEKIHGVNAVARGESTGANASGAQLAMLQATSLEAATPLRRKTDDSAGAVAMTLIRIAATYMEHDLAVVVYGEFDATAEETITGSDLRRINRVRVKPGNIIGKTLRGRVAIADTLMDRGLIQDVRDYFLVLETGRLEPATRAPSSERALVQYENQQMLRGETPIVLAHDDDAMHIVNHKMLLDSPAARAPNSPLLAIVTEHIEQHEMNAVQKTQQRPWLLELLGQQPLQSLMAMAGMGAQPPGAEGGPSGGGGGAAGALPGGEPTMSEEGAGGMPGLPSLPKNPMTGEQWNPNDGGGAVSE